MQRVWPAAIARVGRRIKDMQAVAECEGANITPTHKKTSTTKSNKKKKTNNKHINLGLPLLCGKKSGKQKYDLTDEVKQYLQLG